MMVFRCKDHLMTAITGGYGVVYLTPDRMLDWSDGEAVLSVDVSTMRMSGRDWWDLWLTEFGAQLALPLSDREVPGAVGTDLQGPPAGDFLHVSMGFQDNTFEAETNEGLVNGSGENYTASSATQRDTFELRINGSTFSFCKPNENLCWVQDQPHRLNVTRAIVQIGHHAYDPTKAVGANANGTWHWDNLSLSDSVPYTLIRANERFQMGSGTFTFPGAAPEGSYLRFSAIGKVRLNGQLASPQVPTYSLEHYNSYLVPVAAGTTSVSYQGLDDGWFSCGIGCAMKDVSIVSHGVDGEARVNR
jgi:hypothetical protein